MKKEILLSLIQHPGYHKELLENPPKRIEYKSTQNFRRAGNFYYYSYKDDKNRPMHAYLMPILYNNPFVIDVGQMYYPWIISNKNRFLAQTQKLIYPPNENLINFNRLKQSEKFFCSKNCKQILPWSKWCEEELKKYFKNEKINNKTFQLYPAIKNVKFRRKKRDDVRLIFIGGDFKRKGGTALIEAYEKIKNKYDVELTIVSRSYFLDKKILSKIKKLDINLFLDLNRKKVFDLFAHNDIFVFPTKIDDFGMVFLEAMNFKLPIITTCGKGTPAMKEIIKDNKNGLLINMKNNSIFQEELIQKMKLLIENDSLRRKIGQNGKKEIEDGKFCIEKRNKKLLKIYNEFLF